MPLLGLNNVDEGTHRAEVTNDLFVGGAGLVFVVEGIVQALYFGGAEALHEGFRPA